MEVYIGIIIGILLSILVVLTLTFFRSAVEQRIKILETTISGIGPKPKGFIHIPEEDAEIKRQEILAKNKKLGVDTPLADLYE
jgi:hypothetical protein